MAKKSADDTIVDIQSVIASSESFFEKNRKGIIIGLSAIAVAFAGFFAYQFLYKQPKEKDAANLIYACDYWAEKDSLDWAVNGKDGAQQGRQVVEEQLRQRPAVSRRHGDAILEGLELLISTITR